MRTLLTHNLGLKIVSFLIAVAIWYRYSLVSPQPVAQTFERRLKVIHKEPQLSVSQPLEDSRVRITLSGRRLDLMQVERQLEAQVDMINVHDAIGDVRLNVELSYDPALNIKVLGIEPDKVKVNVRAADPVPSASHAPPPSSPVLD